MTSLFYGVNWCQFYPNQRILVHFHGSFIFVNVDITGFVRGENSSFSIAKFSKNQGGYSMLEIKRFSFLENR